MVFLHDQLKARDLCQNEAMNMENYDWNKKKLFFIWN